MSDPISRDLLPTHEQDVLLSELVREGDPLTVEQHHHLAKLLNAVGSAVRVASQATEIYPDAPERQDRFVAGLMELVRDAYAELLAVSPTPTGCSGVAPIPAAPGNRPGAAL